MLDLHWLNTFVTLARLKHFGKTATELHMTQPNVSLHIKQLEQATRVKLIERNPFRLTQAGERLLQSAQNTLMELQVCQADLNAINDLWSGDTDYCRQRYHLPAVADLPVPVFQAGIPRY